MRIAFWAVVLPTSVLGAGVAMSFTAVQLALNDISPSHLTLGTLNALALTINSGIRAVAPGLFASIYATGVRMHILGGQLAWIILIVLALILIGAVQYLPKKAEGKLKQHDEVE